MKNTRRNILLAAKQLFNEQGIANITLRRIASELGISQGNLNYHFKKREDILEVLYFEMVKELDKSMQELGEKPIDLAYIFLTSRINMRLMFEYRFIWTDLQQLFRENQAVCDHFLAVEVKRRQGFEFVIQHLITTGIMRSEAFKQEYTHLIDRFITYSDSWISSLDMYRRPMKQEEVEAKHRILMEMFFPYLTEQGKEAFFEVWKGN